MNTRERLLAVLLTIVSILAIGGYAARAQEGNSFPGAPAPEAVSATLLGTAFTYQGELKQNGSLYNGTCDFRFGLWDALTNGNPVPNNPFFPKPNPLGVPVTSGRFAVQLDFGNVFNGQALWLESEVRCPAGSGTYTLLSPRTALTSAPYAQGLRPGAAIVPQDSMPTIAFTAKNTTTASGIASPIGIFGEASQSGNLGNLPGKPAGVYGASDSGYGVYGSTVERAGVYGYATGVGDYKNYGLYGESASSKGNGVYGLTSSISGGTVGVFGESKSTSGYGVWGFASALTGYTFGVRGTADSPNGIGVDGVAFNTTGDTVAVRGYNYSNSGTGVFGYAYASLGATTGIRGQANSLGGFGVFGYAPATSGTNYGVAGQSASTNGVGTSGYASAATGLNIGVRGQSDSFEGYGVYGYNNVGGFAGGFDGKVAVYGTLSKTAGNFQIDHPLDPANQYLNHSFVESPDMKNIYDGVVVLDANGEATVSMPDWFQALNGDEKYQSDYRYQLTPIGAAMPSLYIAQEIEGNAFKIAGGAPGMKVSWQVTGIRHDPYAEANRIPVEQSKPANQQGTYLFPALYGQPASLGVNYSLMQAPSTIAPEQDLHLPR